jgi:hypothetical protein
MITQQIRMWMTGSQKSGDCWGLVDMWPLNRIAELESLGAHGDFESRDKDGNKSLFVDIVGPDFEQVKGLPEGGKDKEFDLPVQDVLVSRYYPTVEFSPEELAKMNLPEGTPPPRHKSSRLRYRITLRLAATAK